MEQETLRGEARETSPNIVNHVTMGLPPARLQSRAFRVPLLPRITQHRPHLHCRVSSPSTSDNHQ